METFERSKLIPTSQHLEQELEAFLHAHDAVLVDDVPATETTPGELVWRLRENVELMYVEDPLIGSSYLVFTGVDIGDLVHDLTAAIPCWDLELIRRAESQSADAATRAALVLDLV